MAARVEPRLRSLGYLSDVVEAHRLFVRRIPVLDRIEVDDEIQAVVAVPLFRSAPGRTGQLTDQAMHRVDVYRMILRHARDAGLDVAVCCLRFRATGITAYLENSGTLANAQPMAAHESPRTTELYDRTGDEITLDEIERIAI